MWIFYMVIMLEGLLLIGMSVMLLVEIRDHQATKRELLEATSQDSGGGVPPEMFEEAVHALVKNVDAEMLAEYRKHFPTGGP